MPELQESKTIDDRPSMLRRHGSPDSDSAQNAEHGGANSRAEVHDHGSKTLATLAVVLGAAALGAILVFAILVPYLIGAMVREGNANVRASVQEQVAVAQATAQAAKEHARVALDKVEQTQVQLGAKGLVQPSTH